MQINKFAPASISSEVIPLWSLLFTEISFPKVANCAWKNVCCLSKFRTKRKFRLREDFEYREEETGTFHGLSKSTH